MKRILGSVSYFSETDHDSVSQILIFFSRNEICDPFQKSMKRISKSDEGLTCSFLRWLNMVWVN